MQEMTENPPGGHDLVGHVEMLNLRNRMKDCRRYGPSFVQPSATIVYGDTVNKYSMPYTLLLLAVLDIALARDLLFHAKFLENPLTNRLTP